MKAAKQDKFISYPPEEGYYNFNSEFVPSLYILASQEGWKLFKPEEEATDREILRFLERSGELNFLKDPEEDIYGLDDGEAV